MNHTSRLTQAIIDLDALVNNYQYIDQLTKNSNTIAVIKADAYGHDATKVAEALSEITEYFAVGFIDEALMLRSEGINNKILIPQHPNPEKQQPKVFLQLSISEIHLSFEFRPIIIQLSSICRPMIVQLSSDYRPNAQTSRDGTGWDGTGQDGR